ncbi:MAG: peptide chain release factor N(5)-glutamine methyltransferase [Chloroflexi bacterium]|nr:peptide chain release factor N(5)-glutamine methyltransferase [Chloroflexota bacterium]
MTGSWERPGTVGALLRDGAERLAKAGSESARLDAELLLGHVLGVERTAVLAHPDALAGDGQREAFGALLHRREAGEPVAYIRGLKEFYGLAFSIDRRALIPRPETERLVDLALERVRHRLTSAPRSADAPPLRMWDVGTGCGAIAVALARTLDRGGYGAYVTIVASDISAEALDVAKENVVAHGLADRVVLVEGDLLAVSGVASDALDIVVANLPYVPGPAIAGLPIAASFEPRIALDGGPDGLTVVRGLLQALPGELAEAGLALIEIGSDQADLAGAAAAESLPGWHATVHDDLTGRPRVLEVGRS